jgi:DNA-binding IclR family transcriptional regulator
VSRISRPLYATYGALFTWLAYCAVQSARNQAPWTCTAFVVGSGLVIVAAVREGELEDALRRETVRAERDARLNAVDASEAVAAVAAAGWCCNAWAASAGGEHEPGCRKASRGSTT